MLISLYNNLGTDYTDYTVFSGLMRILCSNDNTKNRVIRVICT